MAAEWAKQSSPAVKIACAYISAACNRTPQSAKWSPERDELVYGSGRSLAVTNFTDPSAPVVRCTLTLHKDRVNCVHFIQFRDSQGGSDGELISGSVDKTVILWKKTGGNYTPVQTLSGHDGSINALAASYLRGGMQEKGRATLPALVATASADSTVKIWAREEHGAVFTLKQTMSFDRGFVFGMDMFLLAKDVPLLACGSDDSKVLLCLWRDGQFTKVLCLAGHEDWVRDVQFCQENGSGDLLLATCSQDSFVRLWRIREAFTEKEQDDVKELTVKENAFTLVCHGDDHTFVVTLEAVLIGHEDWVYSVDWQPPIVKGGVAWQPPCLLTASMDKTMIIWKPEEETGMWLEQTRVGEVGGNTLGLFGGIFSSDGTRIVAHGYHGAFHIWKRPEQESGGLWTPQVAPGGHFGPVLDLSWDPQGKYFVSVSSDQTVRLHARWVRENVEKDTWHEVARPQVHGYDMTCVSMVTSTKYVSGADEKVMRVFDAPQNFVSNILSVSGIDLREGSEGIPLGASVPALGLSNKAVCSEASQEEKEPQLSTARNLFSDHQVPFFTPTKLTAPPVEETLLQNTLWPEVQKLYGHGYEIFAVSASPKGDLVASVSKATKQEHATIRLWEVGSWRQVGVLSFHTLTVTQLAFSHSGERILAVSRDRCWSLWKRSDSQDGGSLFDLEANTDKGDKTHSRIIWSCSWSPDDLCFVTVSRDKKAVVWSQESAVGGSKDCGNGWRVAGKPLESGQPITAVDIAPVLLGDKEYLLALGHENGALLLYKFSLVTGEWALLSAVADDLSLYRLAVALFWLTKSKLRTPGERIRFAHCSTVKCVQWQPVAEGVTTEIHEADNRSILLASCCADGTVRLHTVSSDSFSCIHATPSI